MDDDTDMMGGRGSEPAGCETTGIAGPRAQPNPFGSPLDRDLVFDELRGRLFGDLPDARAGVAPHIGRFSILRRLGQGGMGVVYAGYDERLDRKAAIKVLSTQRRSGDARERMLREAQALARLSHPNVVQIYESGEHGDDVYIAMEYVEGVTLGRWLEQGERGLSELLKVFTAAGEGLAAAHDKGLVHRDFKPDNVMIDEQGRVRVMDFGLVRAQGDDAHAHDAGPDPDDSTGHAVDSGALAIDLTTTGARMGTPAYMAPEQYNAESTDARTDQFSFCVSLWEALYGERPFSGQTLGELAVTVTSGQWTEPPRGAAVPAALRKVLERGLAQEPDARWASMGALLDAVQGASASRSRWRRPRLLAGVAALALLGAGLTLAAFDPESISSSPSAAAAPLAGNQLEDIILRSVRCVDAEHCEISRELVDVFAAEPTLLDKQLRGAPTSKAKGGEFLGFLVPRQHPGRLLHALGLRRGDLVRAVDGQPMQRERANWPELGAALRSGRPVVVEFERDHVAWSVAIRVLDELSGPALAAPHPVLEAMSRCKSDDDHCSISGKSLLLAIERFDRAGTRFEPIERDGVVVGLELADMGHNVPLRIVTDSRAVITRIGDVDLARPEDLKQALLGLARARVESFTLGLERDGVAGERRYEVDWGEVTLEMYEHVTGSPVSAEAPTAP